MGSNPTLDICSPFSSSRCFPFHLHCLIKGQNKLGASENVDSSSKYLTSSLEKNPLLLISEMGSVIIIHGINPWTLYWHWKFFFLQDNLCHCHVKSSVGLRTLHAASVLLRTPIVRDISLPHVHATVRASGHVWEISGNATATFS